MDIPKGRITKIAAKREGEAVEVVVILTLRAKGGIVTLTPAEAMRLGKEFEAAAIEALKAV